MSEKERVMLKLKENSREYILFVSPVESEQARTDQNFAMKLLAKYKAAVLKQSKRSLSTDFTRNSASAGPSQSHHEAGPSHHQAGQSHHQAGPSHHQTGERDRINCTYSDEEGDEDLENLGVDQERNRGRLTWNEDQTLLLLALFEENQEKFNKNLITNKVLWSKIAGGMKARGYKFTQSQCSSKLDSLKRAYRNVRDHNAQSGNSKKTCDHYEMLDELFQTKKWVQPLSVAGSNIPLGDDLEDNDCEDTPQNKKRRVSTNIAKVEFMAQFLENQRSRVEAAARHHEKVEKLHEDRLQVLKELSSKLNKE